MANAEQYLDAILADPKCKLEVEKVFGATPRAAPQVVIGELHTKDCCFVRDEIQFINGGRLIFDPDPDNDANRERHGYCETYSVICRKIRVVGGGKPLDVTPCSAENPGSTYATKNVITWGHRLIQAQAGADPNPLSATAAQNFNYHAKWTSGKGIGDNGKNGDDGPAGIPGNSGEGGMPGPNFVLVCLEVEMVGVGAHLVLDWDGQVGGKGGRGQNGGDGGHGVNGRIGESDTSWPGTGCDRQPGNGGKGGNGGDGGPGGTGGAGGSGGDIAVLSTQTDLTGVFVGGDFTYVFDGDNAGEGGSAGIGGKAGKGGNAGFPTSECGDAADGVDGLNGQPETFGSTLNKGAAGFPGAPGNIAFLPIVKHPVSNLIPLPIGVSSVTPTTYCRPFGGPANNLEGTVTGTHLAQVTGVATGITGVTLTKKATSTDTQLDLKVDLAGNSGLGSGDLVFSRDFGSGLTKTGAITVMRFEVLAVAPGSGARGTQVNATVTGQCFDPSAAVIHVLVSGIGVTATNVAPLNDTTLLCTLDIGALAALGARDVTVVMGAKTHTLLNAFTVTA